jgi:protease-4
VFYAGYRQARRRTITTVRREVVHLTLTGAVPDRRPPRRLFGANPPTTYDWVSLLERAGEDQAVRAVVLTIADPHLGWARITELRHAVTRLRARGKYVVAYLEGTIGNGEYYLATAADEIIVPPVATIDFIGLRAEVTFVKRLLDKIGVTADLEHIGDYKSASDLLTRTEMSPEHREAVDQLLDDFDQALRLGVATGRAASLARIDEWIDHGPYVSIDAVTAGLIDRVAYADEVDDIVRAAAGPINTRIKAPELAHRLYHNRHWGALPRVAVVFAEGTIAGGRDREALGLGKVMGAETISNAIRRAREDRDVVAIVLRVNSGGGSVFASDKIWREVERTVGQKPIVVSFGDIAASGGYYIAATADSIFALPNTVTGSIGIISGKFDMSALHDKIGMDKETVTRGRFADLGTSTRAYSDEERAVVVDQMQRGYERFIGLVAEGRSLPVDSVDALGRGRVWSGTAALAAGLVDRHADLHEVITVAARMAGVRSGRTVRVEVLPRSGWELFDFGAPGLLAAFSGRGLAGLVEGLAVHTGLGFGGDPAYRVPFTLTIE